MDEKVRGLVRLSAAVACREAETLRCAFDRAAAHASAAEIEETLLQSYLFLGYPAALQALGAWREWSGLPAAPAADEDSSMWRKRGEEVCAAVYGGRYERLRENIARVHPEVERWMLMEGYGKVLGRPGLPLTVRELCAIALLMAQEAPTQLYSHLRGALNVGVTPADVEEALRTAGEVLPAARAGTAFGVWDQVRERARESSN